MNGRDEGLFENIHRCGYIIVRQAKNVILLRTIIPSLGMKYSHTGNKTFPAWEYECQRLSDETLCCVLILVDSLESYSR